MDFSNYKFRCSSLGYLMTEARSKSEALSETTKSYLLDIYIEKTFNRRKDITSKFMEKGLNVEENSIDLLSSVRKEMYFKNEVQFKNEYISGTPDIITDSCIIDIKSSWDIYTFGKAMKEENKNYFWQLQGYMWLTGLEKAELCYCLVETPDILIEREIKKALYQSGISENDNSFLEYKIEMETHYRHTDIPKEKRVHSKNYEISEPHLMQLQMRVEQCRDFLNSINW